MSSPRGGGPRGGGPRGGGPRGGGHCGVGFDTAPQQESLPFFLGFVGVSGDRDDGGALVDVHQAHPL
ncbi:hypothetical protein, partial [uncultured Gordonia sp.]|uniref:hypothetical protein n=1 Tax=uncultured Gordonia sp. TaxID=198437 RepID=UPI002619CC36